VKAGRSGQVWPDYNLGAVQVLLWDGCKYRGQE
jgi:hypothetical protein